MGTNTVCMVDCDSLLFSLVIIDKSYISFQRVNESLVNNSRLFKGLSSRVLRLPSGLGENGHSVDA